MKTCGVKDKDVVVMPHLNDTRFIEYFEKKVRSTIRKYNLFTKKDKIGVAVSGGKDSIALLYVLNKLGYNIEAISIDAHIGCYTEENLKNLKEVCKKYKIKLHVVSFRKEFGHSLCYIVDVLKEKKKNVASCMVCGILKRYLLNKYSKKFGFNYLATGHNLDDEAQAFIMNVFRSDDKLARRQGIKSTGREGFVSRVKPLYWLSENEIIRYCKIFKFPVNYGICPCSVDAYRRKYLNMLDEFEKQNPSLKYNILKFHEKAISKGNEKDARSQASLTSCGSEASSCEDCGEPCSQGVCKVCEILKMLKE
jgi:uncharacterized protein (TIGR00269 family)